MYEKITHIDLFSGIGGFALAADRVFGNVEHVFCDNEPFAQEVLKKHWSEAQIYGDIRTLTYASCQQVDTAEQGRLHTEFGLRGRDSGAPILGDIRTFTNTRSEKSRGLSDSERKALASAREGGVFILTGGFPCQPFSQAGRRRGEEDDRFLWPEMLRVIREFSPLWVIAENVRGLLTQGGGVVFERVCTDLEAAGYEVQPLIIPAVAVGAPHRRDRVWFVAHRKSGGRNGGSGTNSEADRGRMASETGERSRARSESAGCDTRTEWSQNWLEVATRLCRMDDGIPRRMDRNPRLKALGNAIVPQVAEEIMRAITLTNHTQV